MNQTGLSKGLTGELECAAHESAIGREQCVREQGVGAAATDRGGISGWWLHGWSLAVTAADGWWNPSAQHVFSSIWELNTDRRHTWPTRIHILSTKKSELKTELNCKTVKKLTALSSGWGHRHMQTSKLTLQTCQLLFSHQWIFCSSKIRPTKEKVN